MGLLVGHGSLLLGLRGNARDSRLYPEDLKGSGFELSGDDAESSVLAAFQLVQSGWGQPGLPRWGSVVDNTEMKGPIDLNKIGIRYQKYSLLFNCYFWKGRTLNGFESSRQSTSERK